MKLNKKIVSLLLVCLMVLTACRGKSGNNEAAASSTSSESANGKTEILLWHSMGGERQEALEKIVNEYNEKSEKFFVNAQNQGTYDESTSKFFNMGNTSGRPAIIQIGEQNLQSMIDSNLVADVNELMSEYKMPVDEFVSGVVSFYSVDDKMYAIPFNASSPVIYYNVKALEKANVEVPQTFDDIINMTDSIKSANNGMLPFSMTAYGYAIDQMVTNLDGFIVNNDNGRSDRATEVAYMKEAKIIYDFIATLVKNGDYINYGRSFENITAGFINGDIAMFITTSAFARGLIDSTPFEVGIANLPTVDGIEPQGVYAGGGAMCLANNLSDEEKEGVMDFLKYATSPEVQAKWASDTGYFSINKLSFETEIMKKTYEEFPALKVAADQYLNAKQTKKTAGPLLSQLPQLRNDLQDAMEAVFNGEDVDKALEQAAKNTNEKIENANRSIGK